MAKNGWQKGTFNKMLRNIDKTSNEEILVGVVKRQSHKGDGKPVDMASLYLWQDQGTKNIPKRETLRPAVKNHDFKGDARDLVKSTITGGYISSLTNTGKGMEESVKKEIVDIKTPPLSPVTIKRRGGTTNPLVHTKQLLNSIGSRLK